MGKHRKTENDQASRQRRPGWLTAAAATRLTAKIIITQAISWVIHDWWQG